MRERDIFDAALAIADPVERCTFLDKATAGNQELRRHLEGLLQMHGQLGSFLEAPAPALAATVDDPIREWPGTVIGPYRLLEQIGEGGMGLVFVAEQHEPVKRRVALKVIKPGMDSRQVIARFEAERQALATMDHPHIAKIHDGGTTPDGRPFFVMELVKGTPITDYCDAHRLTTRQRLQLFLDVCQAVQHAHQKGIIHRDLKPSNILVSHHDVTPVVKVIDFGIAKATSGRLTDKTVYTAFAQMVGTPLYMSPEQAGLSDLDVDTRSDVYSLGVLLYELLSGTTPFDRETFHKASYDEMRRMIREDEPARPSTRLSTMEPAELSTIAERRGLEPHRLSQHLRGELDWIVMKALEKDRNRRYESASAFAADVQRYLEDQPVQACPPSKLYLLRKFARRHKAGLGVAAVLLVVALLGASSLLWWQQKQMGAVGEAKMALREAHEYLEVERWSEALSAARRAEGVLASVGADTGLRQQVQELIRDLEMARDLEEAQLRRTSVKDDHFDWEAGAKAYTDAFQKYGLEVDGLDPGVAAEKIRARPIHRRLVAALDDWAFVLRNLKAKGWRHRFAIARAADPDAWRNRLRDGLEGRDRKAAEEAVEELVAAQIEEWPVQTLVLLSRQVLYTTWDERVIALLVRAQQQHPNDFWINAFLSEILQNSKPRRLEERLRFASIAVALQPQSPGAHLNLGFALYEKGQLDAAIAEYREALRFKNDYAAVRQRLGFTLHEKGQLDAAIAEYREALRLDKDHAETHYNLGTALIAKGQLDDAIAALRQGINLKKDYAEAHNNLGYSLRGKGQLDDAIHEYRAALRIKKDYAEAHNNLGIALMDKGQLDDAIAAYREAIRLKKDYADAHSNLGTALAHKVRLDEAIAEIREAICLNKDHADAHNNLGLVLLMKGLLDEAIAECRAAIRIKKDYAEAHFNLGQALVQKGQFQEAVEELRLGHQLGSRNPRWPYPSAQWLQNAERMLALDHKLSAVLKGKEKPADVGERLTFAQLCQMHRKRHTAAVGFYSEAFELQKNLTDDRQAQHRYNAACSAALAGCGEGKDAPTEDAERARLRRRALDWLRADLKAEGELLKSSGQAEEARKRLEHWLVDTDFNGVRGTEALKKLPEAERQAWQQLWKDVADTLAKSQGKTPAKKKPDTQ